MSDPSRHASEDIDLLVPDIQGLASADALVAFFARLGWKTEGRITQQPGNLGITAESVRAPIKKIELIADSRDGLQVYLFELKSVTVAHTRVLARNFRNLSGNFLLVLTSDYQQIDFVVLHRVEGEGEKQAGIRARGLTVERRAPEKVHLRVLRRFTWTEGDGFAQYFKLLSAFDVADWSEEQFNNRALFSDYYLKERLPQYPEWKDDPKPAWREFREIYREASGRFAAKPEKEIRAGLLEPALKLLGFSLQPGKLAGSSEAKADYTLFAPGDPEKPAAFCLAYPWNRWLDGKDDQRDAESPEENPGAVVVSLLEGNAAPWGIVTNGRLWRLYSQKTHAKATNYFEIDLEEVLSLKPEEDTFRYFWLLFRAKAFEAARDPAALTLFEDKKAEPEPTGAERKPSLLDRLLTESENYAKELGERLKGRVFEEIFPHLAEGFITHIREKEGKDADLPEERLGEVFHGTLTLLYRLLFLLYAESRDLLPVRETRGYFEASLTKLKREIAGKAGTIDDQVADALKEKYRDDEYGLWKRLTRLFQVVDKGDAELNVPLYNGGLFITDPAKDDLTPEAEAARFLSKHKIPDRHLARALDLLSRDVDDKRHDLVMIDYKSLGVRQLGSIYEGLLEFRVRIAPEKLAIVKEKNREHYVSFRDLDDKAKEKAEKQGRYVRKGAVYLENDKRERKATGSYYTPDYIVKYIVENAVGPVLKEKFDAFRPRLREAQQWQREMKRLAAAKGEKQSKYDHGPAVENKWQELVNGLFDVKVLDPAMGSGHFLVEAVDFVTDKTIDFLNGFPWNPVFAHLEAMRGTILSEMDRQQITIDRNRLTDVNLLKRHVLKRCIYGVDLNPMAVELAKVSLWLDCFTLGAPLSFLDHHLRCGNSLIGATENEIESARKGQMSLLTSGQAVAAKAAVGAMLEVGALPDATAEQAVESRSKYRGALSVLEPYKRLFDVYTSQWFTGESKPKGKKAAASNPVLEFLRSAHVLEWAQHPDRVKLSKDEKPVAETAAKSAHEHRFFHWELEFPEVFFGPKPGTERVIERLEGAGFDAIVGNPPYGRDILSSLKHFFDDVYVASEYKVDSFALFIERSLRLSNKASYIGLIIPNSWFDIETYQKLRKLLLNISTLRQVINLGKDVFEGANIDCAIVITGTGTEAGITAIDASNHKLKNERIKFPVSTAVVRQEMWSNDPEYKFRVSSSSSHLSLFHKIVSISSQLDTKARVSQGIIPYNKKAISEKNPYISSEQQGKEWKPFLDKGSCISRFSLLWNGQYIKYGPWLYTPNKQEIYECDKILVQRHRNPSLRQRIVASLDTNKYFYKDNIVGIDLNDSRIGLYSLLGILNSKLMNLYYRKNFTEVSLNPTYIRKLPIRFPSETDGKSRQLWNEIGKVSEVLSRLYSSPTLSDDSTPFKADIAENESILNKMVYEIYELTSEDIGFIEEEEPDISL